MIAPADEVLEYADAVPDIVCIDAVQRVNDLARAVVHDSVALPVQVPVREIECLFELLNDDAADALRPQSSVNPCGICGGAVGKAFQLVSQLFGPLRRRLPIECVRLCLRRDLNVVVGDPGQRALEGALFGGPYVAHQLREFWIAPIAEAVGGLYHLEPNGLGDAGVAP